MRCASGHENPDGTNFCATCGLALGGPAPVVARYVAPSLPPSLPPPPVQFPQMRPMPRNGLGTASLVLGIIGLLFGGCILGPLAIIFGGIGISRANQGQATNKGVAIAGLVLGIVGTIFWLLLAAVTASGA